MHELSVTEHVLDIALRHAQQAGAARITDLYLVIGQLSSIVDDSVQFYWDFVSQDTPAAGATLHFRRIPGALTCRDCSQDFAFGDTFECPACGSARVHVTRGEEFFLEAIDVEEADEQIIKEGAA